MPLAVTVGEFNEVKEALEDLVRILHFGLDIRTKEILGLIEIKLKGYFNL